MDDVGRVLGCPVYLVNGLPVYKQVASPVSRLETNLLSGH